MWWVLGAARLRAASPVHGLFAACLQRNFTDFSAATGTANATAVNFTYVSPYINHVVVRLL